MTELELSYQRILGEESRLLTHLKKHPKVANHPRVLEVRKALDEAKEVIRLAVEKESEEMKVNE